MVFLSWDGNGINPKIIKSILELYNKEIIVNYNYIRKSIDNIINIENDKLKSIDRLLNNSDLSKVFMRGFVYLQTKYISKQLTKQNKQLNLSNQQLNLSNQLPVSNQLSNQSIF